MKRVQILCVAAVLLTTGTVSANLMVYEYVPGQKVTLDTLTGHYWYWNMADFVAKTYDDQISAISGLGTYGNIAGGWHMATDSEMQALWTYDASTITGNFGPNAIVGQDSYWIGRYDLAQSPGFHYIAYAYWYSPATTGKLSLTADSVIDSDTDPKHSAWVTTDAPVVPAPGALVLAAAGLLSSLLGVNRAKPGSSI